MKRRRHVRLPFGASRDALLVDTVLAAFREPEFRIDSWIACVTESEERASHLERLCFDALGVRPPLMIGSVDGLIERIARRFFPDVIVPSPLTHEWLLKESVAANLPRHAASPRTLELLREALARVKVALPPAEREHALRVLRVNAERAGDDLIAGRIGLLERLLGKSDTALRTRGFTDPADLEWLLAERIDEALRGLSLLIIDDPYRLGPAQEHFLRACVEHAPQLVVITRAGPSGMSGVGTDSPYESVAAPARAFFEKSAAPEARVFTPAPDSAALPQARRDVLDALLASPEGARTGIAAEEEKSVRVGELEAARLTIVAAHTPRQEARRMVREIKRLVLEHGIPPTSIGVCFVSAEGRREALKEFELAGVPYSSAQGRELGRCPPVAALLALVEVALDGFPREAFLAALRSPWLTGLGRSAGLSSGWEDFVPRLAALSRRARVIAGVEGQHLAESWLPRLRALAAGETEYGGPLRDAERQTIDEAARLFDWLDALAPPHTMEALAERLLFFASRGAVAEALERDAAPTGGGEAAFNLAAFRRFTDMLRALKRESAGARAATSPRLLLSELRVHLSRASIHERDHALGVKVGGLLDVRGVPVDYLFVGGLTEGEVPFPDPENPFLPSAAEAHAGHLTSGQRRALHGDVEPLAAYRHLLACALANGGGGLWLSYALNEGDTELSPSLPLLEICDACGVNAEAVRRRALREGVVGEALSWPDLQRRLADTLSDVAAGAPPAPLFVEGDEDSAVEWARPAARGIACNLSRDAVVLEPSPWEGRVTGAARDALSLDALTARRDGAARAVSASMLETYAQCPMKFFFRYGLRIKELERPQDEAEARETGALLHEVLERFFLRVRETLRDHPQAVVLERVSGGTSIERLPLLDLALFERVAERTSASLLAEVFAPLARESGVPSAAWRQWNERVLASLQPGATLRSELSLFLETEKQHQRAGLFPWLVEYRFGERPSDEGAATSIRDALGRSLFHLQGAIDRVDVVVRDEEPRALLVRDYKSGVSTALGRRLRDGTAFQLPLYALVALEAAPGLQLDGFFFQRLPARFEGKGMEQLVRAVVDTPFLTEELFRVLDLGRKRRYDPRVMLHQTLPERMAALNDATRAGHFHPTLVDGEASCVWCGFRAACHVRAEKQRIIRRFGAEMRERFGVYFPLASDASERAPEPGGEEAAP